MFWNTQRRPPLPDELNLASNRSGSRNDRSHCKLPLVGEHHDLHLRRSDRAPGGVPDRHEAHTSLVEVQEEFWRYGQSADHPHDPKNEQSLDILEGRRKLSRRPSRDSGCKADAGHEVPGPRQTWNPCDTRRSEYSNRKRQYHRKGQRYPCRRLV